MFVGVLQVKLWKVGAVQTVYFGEHARGMQKELNSLLDLHQLLHII